jgi:hypothetical protein
MKKEEFLKLKQLDRIEYILLNEKNNFSPSTFNFIWEMLVILGYISILGLLMFGFFQNLSLFKILPAFAVFFRWGLVIFVVLDILQFFNYFKNKKRLDQRFLKNANNK